ncbi:DUF7344 domain-containing protein [Palaeococcus sp. (in: euryarchaeotes)]
MDSSSMILGNDRRMLLIEYLQKSRGRAELRDIVEFIAQEEGNTDRKHRKSVYVSLIQTHIPKMERAGIIRFKRGIVELIAVPENVDVYMEIVERHDISWSTFYAGVSIIFGITGIILGNLHLAIVSGIYLLLSIIQHMKVRRIIKAVRNE